MNTVLAQAFAQYNQQMTATVYRAAEQLSDTERKTDRGSFFGSIHATLNHILLVDRIWLGRIIGQPEAFAALDQELYSDFDRLSNAHQQMSQRIVDWAETLTDEQLSADFRYHDMAGKPWSCPLWVAVTQLYNHQTHHRGQLTTLLSQRDIEVGVTDFPWVVEGLVSAA